MAEQNKKNVRVQHKIDTSANWASANIVLLKGEIGLESDTGLVKFGNGVDTWNNLPYLMQDELQEIADAINDIGYELDWKADVEFSNLPDADIARSNLMAAPIDHKDQWQWYGAGDKTYYGHVRLTGLLDAGNNYAKAKEGINWITDFNVPYYLNDAEYAVEFSFDWSVNYPPTLEQDCDLDLYNYTCYFSGVLQTLTEDPTTNPSATNHNGVKQILTIPNHQLTYERYYYYDSVQEANFYTEWKKVGTSEITIHTFELDVPADDFTLYTEDNYKGQFIVPLKDNKCQILAADEVIVDIVASSNATVAEYQQQVYTNISEINCYKNTVEIFTTKEPDMDLRLKFLVMRTKDTTAEEVQPDPDQSAVS